MFCYTDVSRAPLFRAACSRSHISSQHLGNDQPMFYRDIMSSSLSSYTPHNHLYAGPHCNLVVNTVSCQFMLPPPPKMFMYIGLFRFFGLFRFLGIPAVNWYSHLPPHPVCCRLSCFSTSAWMPYTQGPILRGWRRIPA